jgi:hypothetical protein
MNEDEKKELAAMLAVSAKRALYYKWIRMKVAIDYKKHVTKQQKRLTTARERNSKIGVALLQGFATFSIADYFFREDCKVLSLYAKAQGYLLEAERIVQEGSLSETDKEKYSVELNLLQLFLDSVEKKIDQCLH